MLPFRLIAIAQSIDRIVRIRSLLPDIVPIPFAVMLRDPEHDPTSQKQLVDFACALDWSGSATLISNCFADHRIGWTHYMAAGTAQREPLTVGGSDAESEGNVSESNRFGISSHTYDEAINAVLAGADYVTFSPIFPTGSKPGTPGVGVRALSTICSALPVPVIALGGVTSKNLASCLNAGAYGIASISLFDEENHYDLARAVELLASN